MNDRANRNARRLEVHRLGRTQYADAHALQVDLVAQRASYSSFSPAITAAATSPSLLPLCASIGCPATSPIAYTFGALVRIFLSTFKKPFASTARPTLSSASPPLNGFLPTVDRI